MVQKLTELPPSSVRSCLNGYLVQDKDEITDSAEILETVTELEPTADEIEDLLFASKLCKHTKSNTIVLAFTKRNLLALN